MEEISNMNFDHLSFSTFMKRLSNWVLNDGIDMGVKLIIGVLVIAIGFKIINNISKKFLKFAELKAVDVTIVKFLKSCINISLKCILLLYYNLYYYIFSTFPQLLIVMLLLPPY